MAITTSNSTSVKPLDFDIVRIICEILRPSSGH
jgi:hypothetical protein